MKKTILKINAQKYNYLFDKSFDNIYTTKFKRFFFQA